MQDDLTDFGPWLKAQRKVFGLHQAELAKLTTEQGARTLQSAVSAWERGAGRPTLTQYIALMRVFLLAAPARDAVEHALCPLPPTTTPQGVS